VGCVKDLSQLGRPLHRTVLVDDQPHNALLQPSNLVPVAPYHGDADDQCAASLALCHNPKAKAGLPMCTP
jgi:TFIIF-interacting CTD phosphatase-like protein